jgi:CbbQ/NirQ/NorQ C-terminal
MGTTTWRSIGRINCACDKPKLDPDTAALVTRGVSPAVACQIAVVAPLTDDADVAEALRGLLAATF